MVRSLSVSGRMWQKFSGGESGSGLPSVSSDGPAIDPAKGSHQDPDPPTSMSDTHTHTHAQGKVQVCDSNVTVIFPV